MVYKIGHDKLTLIYQTLLKEHEELKNAYEKSTNKEKCPQCKGRKFIGLDVCFVCRYK